MEMKHSIDIPKLQREWAEMRNERDNDHKMIVKFVNELRRAVQNAKSINENKLDSIFAYFTEQLEVLRQTNLA